MIFKNKATSFLKNKITALIKYSKSAKCPSKTLIRNKKLIVACAIVSLALLVPYIPFTNITLAYEVKCEGVTLGYVQSEQVYEQAENIASNSVEGDIKALTEKPEYSVALVSGNRLDNAKQLSEKIIDNSDDVVDAYGIYVGEKCIATAKLKYSLQDSLAFIKNYYIEKTEADVADFADNVKIKQCLSIDTELNTQAQINSAVKEYVKVKTGVYSDKTEKTDYKTVEIKDSSMYKGTSKVTSSGKQGTLEKKIVTYYLDGKKSSTETIKTTIVERPVAEKVLVGTKAVPDVRIKSGATYAWPLVYCSSEYVSSGFGYRSGRLHKGIDICSDYGTSVTAAMDGTIVRAGWFESYGNCIEIKHVDGNMTRYAHCSEITVSNGQQVKMGDIIGKVGSTGRSTGNHLHFEVWENGSLVNPYSYVGQ